jgi:hypothetical protein
MQPAPGNETNEFHLSDWHPALDSPPQLEPEGSAAHHRRLATVICRPLAEPDRRTASPRLPRRAVFWGIGDVQAVLCHAMVAENLLDTNWFVLCYMVSSFAFLTRQ